MIQVITKTIKNAGKLKIVETPGVVPAAAVKTVGIWIPMLSNRLTKYPDHPTETVAAPRAYSKIRSHPIINAITSPNAT